MLVVLKLDVCPKCPLLDVSDTHFCVPESFSSNRFSNSSNINRNSVYCITMRAPSLRVKAPNLRVCQTPNWCGVRRKGDEVKNLGCYAL